MYNLKLNGFWYHLRGIKKTGEIFNFSLKSNRYAPLREFGSGYREIFAFGTEIREVSWALESGIQLKESGIQLAIRVWNPSSTDIKLGIECLESGIHGVEPKILDKQIVNNCALSYPHNPNPSCGFCATVTPTLPPPWTMLFIRGQK